MKLNLKDARAKTQRREEIQRSKVQPFFTPLRLCASFCLLLFACCARAQTNSSSSAVPFLGDIPQFHLTANKLSDAEIQGRQLAKQLIDAKPETNFTQSGILTIRDKAGKATNFLISLKTEIMRDQQGTIEWRTVYDARPSGKEIYTVMLGVLHVGDYFNTYSLAENDQGLIANVIELKTLNEKEVTIPFAHSDFWVCDLGLEFFHWPEQKILKKEVKRSRGCSVLESTNPDPSTNGYSRVVSWIDNDGGGIVQAFAYDAQGKKLKEFYPNSVEKVNGQYQVKEMEIDNVQTGSRTRLTFDLKN
jgi:hypothetical protein